MNDGTTHQQLNLFSKHLTWQELPQEVHEKTIEFIANVCVEIVRDPPSSILEKDHEPLKD